jgi:hypothetical protein
MLATNPKETFKRVDTFMSATPFRWPTARQDHPSRRTTFSRLASPVSHLLPHNPNGKRTAIPAGNPGLGNPRQINRLGKPRRLRTPPGAIAVVHFTRLWCISTSARAWPGKFQRAVPCKLRRKSRGVATRHLKGARHPEWGAFVCVQRVASLLKPQTANSVVKEHYSSRLEPAKNLRGGRRISLADYRRRPARSIRGAAG